jgi:hypothetical protein
VEVLLGHTVPLVRLGDGAVTHECGEHRSNYVPLEEPHFPPPVHGFKHGEVKTRIDTVPRLDTHIHTTKNHYFCVHALREMDPKEVVPQVEVGVNTNEGLT